MDLAWIRVNAVCPGLVITDRVAQWGEERLVAMVARQPLPRGGTPARGHSRRQRDVAVEACLARSGLDKPCQEQAYGLSR